MINSWKSFIYIIVFSITLSIQASEIGPRVRLFKISSVEVQGLKKVEKEAVLDKLRSRAGLTLTNETLFDDIKTIYNLKYFESVEAHQDGNKLIFKVVEKPIIAKIVFRGNDEVDKDDLSEGLKTREYSILDINSIQADVRQMEKTYEEKGFYLANVSYEIRQVDKENVHLVYNISEYDKVRVKKVTFLGLTAFAEEEVKSIMETREESLFSFLSGSGNFKELNFKTDIERIKYFYSTKGYLQVNVAVPEVTVSEDKKWVFITVKIKEGPKFDVRDVYFQGELLFTEDELREKTKLKAGEVYSEELLRRDIQTLTESYQDLGYAFANVIRNIQLVPGENRVDIQYSFEKGKLAKFGRISVTGNTKTRDKVIRRELKIHEGGKYSGSGLRESKENVNRLGFFEPGSVIFNTVSSPGQDDVLDVEISVKEKSTGQISLGAGYSTATGGFFQASISQNNFRGLGQQLSFSTNIAKEQQNFSLSFTEPYFMDSKWTLGGEVFRTVDTQLDSYDYKKHGFAARIGYPIFDYTRLYTTYKLEETELTDIKDPTVDENEDGVTSSVRLAVVKDKRNNRFEPTDGYYWNLATEYAGLGGDKKWWKNEIDLRYFYPVWKELVFRSRFYTGKIEEKQGIPVPRNEKFSLGGARNLRGYDIEDIGPKESVTYDHDNDPGTPDKTESFNIGAPFTAFTTLELEHPLAKEAGLKFVTFFDAGTAKRLEDIDKIYMDYGFGFRWFSPIGVLRFEWGVPINPDPDMNSGTKFHFDIGQLF
ncbi:outer membrane protein assembly factor BamA [Halobacteriovorax sp. HFRX-2_2]|uniref:outer membrane protein assembly factor BamA n=1 Tax=unclassified Halobacteriovorax TaxID=2639665 RepID=UPI00371CB235